MSLSPWQWKGTAFQIKANALLLSFWVLRCHPVCSEGSMLRCQPSSGSWFRRRKRLTRTSHQVWTMLEGRGFTGCGKTLQCCHPERSEGSRSEHFQGSARFFVAAAPQNDRAFEFFCSLFSLAEIAAPALYSSRTPRSLRLQAARDAGSGLERGFVDPGPAGSFMSRPFLPSSIL